MTCHRRALASWLLASGLLVIGCGESRLYPSFDRLHSIDSAGLIAPPFATMALRIEGDDLAPTWPDGDERGR